MITIEDICGTKITLAAGAIMSVSEAGANSAGIQAYVRTFDGRVIETRTTHDEVVRRMAGPRPLPIPADADIRPLPMVGMERKG